MKNKTVARKSALEEQHLEPNRPVAGEPIRVAALGPVNAAAQNVVGGLELSRLETPPLTTAKSATQRNPMQTRPPASAERERVKKTIEDWLAAWQDKNMEAYTGFYHPEFQFRDMDLNAFKEYKTKLCNQYETISIRMENLEIQVDGTEASVSFLQDYRSDQYQDYGLKTLLLVKVREGWRIKKESWQEIIKSEERDHREDTTETVTERAG